MLGAAVGLMVSIALWPVRALDELRSSQRQAMSTGKQLLDARFEDLLSGAARRGGSFTPEQGSAQRMMNHIQLLAQARVERRPGEDLSPRYLRAVVLVQSLPAAVHSFQLKILAAYYT